MLEELNAVGTHLVLRFYRFLVLEGLYVQEFLHESIVLLRQINFPKVSNSLLSLHNKNVLNPGLVAEFCEWTLDSVVFVKEWDPIACGFLWDWAL